MGHKSKELRFLKENLNSAFRKMIGYFERFSAVWFHHIRELRCWSWIRDASCPAIRFSVFGSLCWFIEQRSQIRPCGLSKARFWGLEQKAKAALISCFAIRSFSWEWKTIAKKRALVCVRIWRNYISTRKMPHHKSIPWPNGHISWFWSTGLWGPEFKPPKWTELKVVIAFEGDLCVGREWVSQC